MERKDVESLFNNSRGKTLLVVGDLMLDEYLWGKADRISPEAPVQVVEVTREDLRMGGAGNVINNLVALGCRVVACSVIGGDDNGSLLQRTFTGKGVDVSGVFEDPMRATSRKTRVVAANQQIVRIDRESREPITAEFEERIQRFVNERKGEFDALLISDYAKGVLTEKTLELLISVAREVNIPVVIDPKGKDFSKYRGATILTPNRREAEAATGISVRDEKSLKEAACKILDNIRLEALLITRSEQGMSLFLGNGESVNIPTVAREVFDVTGAGDTVLSVLGLALACGMGYADASQLANIAAGIVVGKVGTSTVFPDEIIDAVGHGHRDTEMKIKNLDVLANIVKTEKEKGRKVVFTNGCFDLLHAGHVKYLQRARGFGDLLVLGLNSDASVRRLKGKKRPLISEAERGHILAALDCIDFLVVFDEDTPLRLIESLKPDILVKGGDYTPDMVVGKELVESFGGRVEIVEFLDGRSTTNIIEKILKNYG
jgi:D-beta-D-heptose 7-phosphate kinase/D-beta-D-heptose 1-phosphate adenosyltransferase